MELAKKSYVESYVNSKVSYTNVGKLHDGNYSYPALAAAKVVIFLFKYDANGMETVILSPNSYKLAGFCDLTLTTYGGIVINGLESTLNLIGFLAFY